MQIQDIIQKQQTNDSQFYLLQQGIFYHAFNESAHFFHSTVGYKVRTRYLPRGQPYELLGFPTNMLDKVINIVHHHYPQAVFTIQDSLITITL